jgi:hypothetical protein
VDPVLTLLAATGPGPHASGENWLTWAAIAVGGSCIVLPLAVRFQRHKQQR